MTVIGVHLLMLLQAQGLTLAAAVALGALVGPAQVGGRLLEMAFGRSTAPGLEPAGLLRPGRRRAGAARGRAGRGRGGDRALRHGQRHPLHRARHRAAGHVRARGLRDSHGPPRLPDAAGDGGGADDRDGAARLGRTERDARLPVRGRGRAARPRGAAGPHRARGHARRVASVTTRFAPSPTGTCTSATPIRRSLLARARARRAGASCCGSRTSTPGRCRPVFDEAISRTSPGSASNGTARSACSPSTSLTMRARARPARAMGLLYPASAPAPTSPPATAAPHGPEGTLYPGTCRHLPALPSGPIGRGDPHAWRLDIAESARGIPADYLDEAARTVARPSRSAFGDVVLARKDTPASYHLSVTVDDALQGVTLVRGADLLRRHPRPPPAAGSARLAGTAVRRSPADARRRRPLRFEARQRGDAAVPAPGRPVTGRGPTVGVEPPSGDVGRRRRSPCPCHPGSRPS